MNEIENFEKIERIFWFTFVLGLVTFFCPFIEGHVRGEVYWKIFKMYALEGKTVNMHFRFILTLLLSTLVWLPIIGIAFYRYTTQKRYYTLKQRMVNYFLFGVGAMIYILPLYVLMDEGLSLRTISIFDWGYWLLLICTTILFVCYLKIQKRQLIVDDLSDHLIIEDEK